MRDGGTPWRKVAEHYGGDVSYATIQRIAEGHEPSAETCRRLGVRKSDRTRISADVTEEQRSTLKQLARDEGYEGWSAYCRALANKQMEKSNGHHET